MAPVEADQTAKPGNRTESAPAAKGETSALLNMDEVRIDPAWALRIPATLALRRKVLPFAELDGHVYVACVDVKDSAALRAIERQLSQAVRPEPAEAESLRRALKRIYGDGSSPTSPRTNSVDVRTLGELDADDAVALCNELLHAAVVRQASDIHVDPIRDGLRIRMRVDGVLEEYRSLPKAAHSGIVSRFKVLAGLDIAEKRAPQDGGFQHTFGPTGQAIDLRVATLPTKFGERMTLRLLALQTESLTLERLGMRTEDLDQFVDSIQKPHGMVLLTGPTGSGKSTTLYAAIRRLLEQRACNVVTVEDPIEYEIPGVAQVEIDSADKVSFSKALRSVLRHDPDVIMIGEIRDGETADIAVKASLTGHLVFSTLHTNSAVSTVTRLCDMGVERYLAAATLRLAVAQRLVRRLCPRCKRPQKVDQRESAAFYGRLDVGETAYERGGCLYCANRGYAGRIGLFEMFAVDESIARMIAEGAPESALFEEASRRNCRRLMDDAVAKIRDGATSIEDVLAVVADW